MRRKILIVEDDRMLSTIFEIFITELGYNYIGNAKTADRAIELCEKELPEIVLMDIHIEGNTNGIETTKIINDKFNIPVIYISSDFTTEIIKNAIHDNVYGCLQKPIYKNNLKSTIEFAIIKHNLKNK